MDFKGGFGNQFNSGAYYNYFSGNGFNLRQDLHSLSTKSSENDFCPSNVQGSETEGRKRTSSCPWPTTKRRFEDQKEQFPAVVECSDHKFADLKSLVAPEEALHILVTGPPRCGKAQLVETLAKRKLQIASNSGPNLAFIQSFPMLGMKVHANVWYMKSPKDCTTSLKDAFADKNFAIILVYDVTVSKTLFDVREYIVAFKRVFGINVPIILVGNKIDMRTLIFNELSMLDWGFLAYCDGQQVKDEYKLSAFVECSGETGYGLNDMLLKASTVALADYFKF